MTRADFRRLGTESPLNYADMMELVDMQDSGSCGSLSRPGPTPGIRITWDCNSVWLE